MSGERDQDGPAPPEERPRLTFRDVVALIWATYKTSAPYLVVFLLLFLLAVWFVTEVVFR